MCDKVFCLHSASRARHSLMSVPQICEKKYLALKESVAITLSTNDLAIECLGVRVATIVKMMKRNIATSGISNFGCAIPGLLAMLHRMVFAVLSRSSEFWNLVVLVLVEDLGEFAWWTLSFRAPIGPACRSSSLDTRKMVFSYRFRWCQVHL